MIMVTREREWQTVSGGKYAYCYVHGVCVGCIEIVADGFIAFGKRKKVETLEEVAKQLIESKTKTLDNERKKLRELFASI
jgi:hypothetical protein